MKNKTFTNEYGEKFTVEVRDKKIWVSSDDIKRKFFLFDPILLISEDTMSFVDIHKCGQLVNPGNVVLKNGVILSSDECAKIYAAALELGYE